jgi:hypothetical protein
MRPFSFVGIFCEDIRDEVSGTHTIVGVLPDNINIGGLPGMLPKLGIYIRIQIDKDAAPKTLKARMKVPGGTVFEIADFDPLIASAKEQAEQKGTPFAGLIAKGTFTPMPITEIGRIEAIVEIDETEYVCGVLNLIPPEAPIEASTASAPPASPPASVA